MRFSENELRDFVNTIPTPAWSSALDGCADFFNQAWLDYTGLSPEQSLQWGWKGAIHPDDLPIILGAFEKAVNSEQPFEAEGRFRRSDGEFRWFLVRGSPLRDVSGKVVKWCGTNTEIDDRKRAEEALRKSEASLRDSEQRFRLIIEGIGGQVAIMSAQGEVEFVNNQVLEYFGKTVEDLKGWSTSNAVHPDDLPHAVAAWMHSVETGDPYDVDHRLRRADGVYRWFHSRGQALRDAQGRIVRWYNLLTDIEDRKRAEDAVRASEQNLRLMLDSIAGYVMTYTPSGEVEFVNKQTLDYFGKTLEELKGWILPNGVHPDDRTRVATAWKHSIETGQPFEVEFRSPRKDGVYRWLHSRGLPLRDTQGHIVCWYKLYTDIEDRKRAEEELRRSEAFLSEAQRLSHTGSAGWDIASGEIYWSRETYRIYELEPTTKVTAETIVEHTHPEDRSAVLEVFERVSRESTDINLEHRLLMPDGRIKYLHVVAHPSKGRSGRLEMVGAVTDITERKRGTEEMRKLASLVENSTDLIGIGSLQGEVTFVNATGQSIVGLAGNEQVRGTKIPDYVAEQDLERFNAEVLPTVFKNGHWEGETLFKHFKTGAAIPMWQHVFFITDDVGRRIALATISRDITERKRAEDKLRRSEESLLEGQRLTHAGSWGHDVASGRVFVSPEVFRIYGINPDDDASNTEFFFTRFHPEDRGRVVELFERSEAQKTPFQTDHRIVLPDGTIKHLHSIGHPVLDQSGALVEFVGTTMDVTEQWKSRVELERAFEEIKHLKDRLQDENLALREQIDQALMFEEIVGSSPALQAVLASVMKVAPTDSTVLISGETGTGKELIARAIHKRSRRSGRAFISVNCASIPPALIASELFGHEKGAFTGALQQRQGRFELAHSGTIFLDEIGELPAETQIALLRVLQERQFERVGGNKVIPTDVRVITATNRDLSAAIAAGTFRSDLFYRLNVFPIEVPPLRKRKQDIPMLVEYFVKRFAEKVGKQISKIDRKTLELCGRYQWPGNIRELQNIVERSVILCSGDIFRIDEAWLSVQLPRRAESSLPLGETIQHQEKEIIEAALAESKGRVAGPNGAALKLGIPRSTLDRKIQQLKIKKHEFTSES
ncbi:MAG TPA: PAS domain-containing protein [Candidatus Sulfotelmatobacter sp.]|nr:PAS domain-containing protein [Candidatus Sulfotelmatobacter sp.]